MEEREYKYDAFISYRHSELDKYVAENLHKALENYELPKNLKEKLGIEGKVIKRVFRDQEELPLSSNLEDPIISALHDSKYLIIICSPRLNDSLWCKKEIETFKALRGRKNMFCVLIEGEPNESFPEEVLYDIDAKGNKIPVEPLAADVRGATKKEVLSKIKDEKLRLIAGMLNIDYDDLKQRHKQREQKRKMMIVSAIASFLLLFSLYTSFMLIKISSQQKKLKLNQAISLSNNSLDYLNVDDRYDAIKSAYEALTKSNGVKMPYTADAEYALSESLGLYDIGSSYKAVDNLNTKGIVDFIKGSEDNKYAAIYDESETLTLFDTKSLNVIKEYNVGNLFYRESYSFVGNDKLAFITDKGNINIVNVKDGKLIKEIKKGEDPYYSVQSDLEGNKIVYNDFKNLIIYDVKEDKEIGKIPVNTNDKYIKNMYFNKTGEYLFVFTTTKDMVVNKQEYTKLHVINASKAEELSSSEFEAGYVEGIVTNGDNVYVLFNDMLGNEFNALVVSYNYKTGKRNWVKEYPGLWGKFISRSLPEGSNHIIISNRNSIMVLDDSNGEQVHTFSVDSEIINIYSYLDQELYLVFLADGSVNYASMNTKTVLEYQGKYVLNVNEYNDVTQSANGFIMLPHNDNRIILYELKTNKSVKKEDIKLDYVNEDSVLTKEEEKIKKNYKINNINLVKRFFYSKKKDLLFVNYTNGDLAVYNTSDKTLIKHLDNVGNVYHYFGKDKYGRTYVGDISDSYILDSEYNKVGHIKGLCKLEKDKVYILSNSKYYSHKIYTLDDLLKEAEKFLK